VKRPHARWGNVEFLCACIYGKLKYFEHVARHTKDMMLGTMPGTRRQGGQRRQWLDNITQWTEKGLVDIVRLVEDRNTGIDVSYSAQPTLVDRARQTSINTGHI